MANDPPDARVRALINAIRAAFPAEAQQPARDALVTCRCDECAEVAEYFAWAERYVGSPGTELEFAL